MNIKLIDQTNAQDLNLPNEAFELFGWMEIQRLNNQWEYSCHESKERTWQVFPDEIYDLQEVNGKGFALGAYIDDQIVGLAVYQDDWKKFMYLHDLKVKQAYRQSGVASKLIEKGYELASKKGYRGLYTIGQDNNLAACQFYLKQGFEIGGFNNWDYRHTSQANKSDIYFYLDKK